MSADAGVQWVDTHCHLDAPEYGDGASRARALARKRGVTCCVMPAVACEGFEKVRRLAHSHGDAYCLGIHPLYVAQASDDALVQLERALERYQDDPHLVAVGEIGLDYFVPELRTEPLRSRQLAFFKAQLELANRFDLPVVLHSRRAVDAVQAQLRASLPGRGRWSGIAHAFSGSDQQAQMLSALGLKLGFGGAATFERASRLRNLLATRPLQDIVLETDAPDIPPQWLYVRAEDREQGHASGINSPAELPAIGAALASVRGLSPAALAHATTVNAMAALPRLGALLQAAQSVQASAHG